MSRNYQLAYAAIAVIVVAAVVLVSGGDDLQAGVPSCGLTAPDEWDARLADVSRRTAAKSALVEELVDGRRTLADVAVQFRRLSGGRPTDSMVHSVYPGSTPGERYSRQVLAYAEVPLSVRPDRTQVKARLAEELDRIRADGGRMPTAAR